MDQFLPGEPCFFYQGGTRCSGTVVHTFLWLGDIQQIIHFDNGLIILDNEFLYRADEYGFWSECDHSRKG